MQKFKTAVEKNSLRAETAASTPQRASKIKNKLFIMRLLIDHPLTETINMARCVYSLALPALFISPINVKASKGKIKINNEAHDGDYYYGKQALTRRSIISMHLFWSVGHQTYQQHQIYFCPCRFFHIKRMPTSKPVYFQGHVRSCM